MGCLFECLLLSQGGTLYPSVRGVCVNIWGFEILQKNRVGVCELQLRKKSILRSENHSLRKIQYFCPEN